MRKTIRRLRRTFQAKAGGSAPPWFFDPFVPDVVTVTGSPHTADLHDEPWEEVPTPVLLAEQQCWLLRPGARWHGFARVTDGYAMTDPNKLTLVTPGFDHETGGYLDGVCRPGARRVPARARHHPGKERPQHHPLPLSSSHPASR